MKTENTPIILDPAIIADLKPEQVEILKAAVKAANKEHKPKSYDGIISSVSTFIAAINVIGLAYAPPNVKLSKANLILAQTSIIAANNASKDAINPEKQILIDRRVAYKLMNELTTACLNALRASENVTPEQILIATNLAKKVKGSRIIPIKNASPVVIAPIPDSGDSQLNSLRRNSVSFQKFGIKVGNLFTFIKYFESINDYKPEEDRLKVVQLLAYHDSLVVLNASADTAEFTTDKRRDERNEAFFDNVKGARFLFTRAKSYIASKFGVKSVEYKMVKGLPFPNLILKKYRKASNNF